MWERGLKRRSLMLVTSAATSLPMWERGLKHIRPLGGVGGGHVAPHVGAWIETKNRPYPIVTKSVAPHVGAWIETH